MNKQTINFIKQYRKALGLTQSQLASILGVSKNTVSHWEIGDFDPSVNAIFKLCSVFDCNFEELFIQVCKGRNN